MGACIAASHRKEAKVFNDALVAVFFVEESALFG
jgi:hypothetical protein